ncbi:gas vesicle protein [Halobacteriales archaeon QS_5_70_15]|nr:MAG: gas vesicle protein [Halobacteriales archaeon QS_5_70_15]
MEPSRTERDAVVDLLDVILESGVIVQADVVIAVAEVPLVGLQLRAALAGIDTMTDYGLLEDWDEETRARGRSAAAPAPQDRDRSADPVPPPAAEPGGEAGSEPETATESEGASDAPKDGDGGSGDG